MKIIFLLLFLPGFLLARPGQDYAVFFVVTAYDDLGWTPLPEAATEVAKLATELKDNYGFQCEIVANPTKQQILNTIDSYNRRTYGPDDQVLFFFSMHGHYDPVINRGFLVAKDGKVRDDYGASWLSYDDLGTYLTRNRCRHVLLALDACYSGSFGIRNRGQPQAPAWETEMDCGQKIQSALRQPSRRYFSSGSKEARTPARSLFASRLLEALRAGGEDGLVRTADIEYMLSRIETPRPESGSFIGHEEGGDFVFVHKDACKGVQRNAPATSPSTDIPVAVEPPSANQPLITYSTHAFGNLTWTTANLNVELPDSWCYNDDPANCNKYGRLYTWEAAQQACASLGAGWRLPTQEEWVQLATSFGGYTDLVTSKDIGDSRKACRALLKGGGSGFDALLGGSRYLSGYNMLNAPNAVGLYWMSNENGQDHAWRFGFSNKDGKVGRYYSRKTDGLSCRCVKGKE